MQCYLLVILMNLVCPFLVIIVVFDLSDLGTLSNTRQWLEDALRDRQVEPLIFLVGSKKDLVVNTVK